MQKSFKSNIHTVIYTVALLCYMHLAYKSKILVMKTENIESALKQNEISNSLYSIHNAP